MGGILAGHISDRLEARTITAVIFLYSAIPVLLLYRIYGSISMGNSRALATVTAIIDGTGSFGAALGPLLTGYIAARGGDGVFIMLMLATLFAALLLTHLMVEEIKDKFQKRQARRVERVGKQDIAGVGNIP
ncbi:hypothetical protein SUGI_0776250 [Cryptomeria japonica]|nr:hypothetical protein SUGI_0776250 [Cryptomeria japonica]